VPKNAVLTVYPHDGANQAPAVTSWTSSAAYLKIGGHSVTTLSASATDPELDAVSYAWSVVSKPAGAKVALATPGAATTSATGLTAAGEYIFKVAVSDAGHTVNREVKLKVYDRNQPPRLGEVHNRLPVRLTLPASSTSLQAWAWDLENDPLAYQWSVVSQPAGASVKLSKDTTKACQASNMTVPGHYVFRVQVSDGTNTCREELTVPVYPKNLNAPFITNAAGQVLTSGKGSLSAKTGDVDGDWVSHWWEVVSAPAGAKVVFSAQAKAKTRVSVNLKGAYQFRLTVVDRTRYATSGVIRLKLAPQHLPKAP
jgi:hypothetical protein